jgi:hypothetical protein
MKLLEGVLLHELVLMILGFIAGLVLLFSFLQSVQRNKPNYKSIYALMMPVVMIGYPSIQRVQFENGIINIEKVSKEVEKNPLDTVLQQQLLISLKKLENQPSRVNESPAALSAFAQAQLALGRYDSAQVLIGRATHLDSTSTTVVQAKQSVKKKTEVKKKFDQKVKQVDKQLKVLEKQPQNGVIRDSIAQALKEVSHDPVAADDNSLITVATAAVAAGYPEAGLELVEKVINVKPSQEAVRLKEQILSGSLSKKYHPAPPSERKKSDTLSIKAIPNAFLPK